MNYQEPELEIIMLEPGDIITLSGDEWGGGKVDDLTGDSTSFN